MGNWTTANITGSCSAEDLPKLKAAAKDEGKNYELFGPLTTGNGLCGLGDWPQESISAIGNLAERDYSHQQVAEHAERLAKAAPSLKLTIHLGGDYESKECAATIKLADGVATIGAPEIRELMPIGDQQLQSNMMKMLTGRGLRG